MSDGLAAAPSTDTRAAETRAVQILTAWLSPAYPVGAYSYSHGLEWAVEAGDVTDATGLRSWTADVVAHGAGRADAILLAHAYAAPDPAPVAELAAALAASAERRLETTAQGAAFAKATTAAWGFPLPPLPYPVAVGRAARLMDLPLPLTATLFVGAFAANLVSAGVRLVPVGQTDGQRIVAALAPLVARVAAEAIAAPLDDVGGCAFRADIAAMRHETQRTRLFRS